MKFLAVHPQPYLLAFGGLCVAQRAMFESLVSLGHSVVVITTPGLGEEVESELLPSEFSIPSRSRLGVRVLTLESPALAHSAQAMCEFVGEIYRRFQPDFIISAEDVLAFGTPDYTPQMGMWTQVAVDIAGGHRVVYCCHSAASLPFGPHSFAATSERIELFNSLRAIITVSQHLKDYILRIISTKIYVIPFPVYGQGPFREFKNFAKQTVGMINPSVIKGSPLFIEIAKQLPSTQFVVVPTWANSPKVMSALELLPNVEIRLPTRDRDELYGLFSVLLVPSLWIEAWGLVAVEAMLRGVPVVAADNGGLREAKMGVPYILPVKPLGKVNPTSLDDIDVEVGDIVPWVDAIQSLLSNSEHYDEIAEQGRERTWQFVSGLNPRDFEEPFLN